MTRKLPLVAAGFTLVEALVAVVMLGITIAVVAPGIFVAIASREQSQQAEQALAIAQAQADRIRIDLQIGTSGLTGTNPQVNLLDQIPQDSGDSSIRAVAAPDSSTASSGCNSFNLDPNNYRAWCAVSLNSDGTSAFAVQTFRTNTQFEPAADDPSQSVPVAFWLGVRVYQIAALQNPGSLAQGTAIQPAALGLTSGAVNLTQPLAVIYMPVVRPDLAGSNQVNCLLPATPEGTGGGTSTSCASY